MRPGFDLRALRRALLALAGMVALAGCGGGVDSGGTGAPTALAAGPVTGLGSVIVNGVRFDDDSATIVDQDGQPLTVDQLQVGMGVEIDASPIVAAGGSATSTALAIRSHNEIVGEVDRVNRLGTQMMVLGQPVRITVATWFDAALPGGIDAVNAGDVVEVWGQYNARTGEYIATRVAPRAGASTYELRGPLAAVDAVARTIVVGGLTISIAAIPASQQPPLTIGTFVRVSLATVPVGGVWAAASLSSGNRTLPDRADVRLLGRISTLTSATQFVVNGVAVDASSASLVGGSAGVVLGARIAVVGSASSGVLKAGTVVVLGDETLGNSTFEVHGNIAALNLAQGTLRLHGITIHFDSGVAYVGGNASDLVNGRAIDVVGTLSADRVGIDAQTITFE